jgi:hypothetical protein
MNCALETRKMEAQNRSRFVVLAGFCAALAFLMIAAGRGAALHAQNGARESDDNAEIFAYRLDWRKILDAANAGDELKALFDSDKDLEKRWQARMAKEEPIAQEVEIVDHEFPQVAAVIRNHGITTRDYVMMRVALLLDAYLMMSREKDPDEPDKDVDEIQLTATQKANVSLLKAHKTELEALMWRIYMGREP